MADKEHFVAVAGCGSIGKRHIRNLRTLGIQKIVAVDPIEERRAEAAVLGAETAAALDEALAGGANIVFITSPNVFHKGDLAKTIQAGCHVFVEKPIASDSIGVAELVAEAAERKLVGYMGSNWKFYPSFQVMREILEAGRIGRVLSARAIAGQFLPDWHPWEDYRFGYSANRSKGGGILLDSHEINYMTWLLGPAQTVACMANKLSDLEIDTEDTAGLLLTLKSGALLEIHVDYNQRTYQRNYDFHGTEGSLYWDYRKRSVSLYECPSDSWTEWSVPDQYDINEMYVQQTRHFLACVEGREEPMTPLSEGLAVLQVIEAAKQSSRDGVFVHL